MIEAYDQRPGNLAAVMEVAPEHVSKYGIIDIEQREGTLIHARGVVEKPTPEAAPSRLAIIGRYLLDPSIFGVLEKQERGASGEIQLTDAIAAMMPQTPLTGVRFGGTRYDCGSKVGFLTANMAVGLTRPDLKDELTRDLTQLLYSRQSTS